MTFGNVYVIYFLIFLIKAYIVGSHLNCIKMGTHNICLYTKVEKKYTSNNLEIMELLDCVLIGLSAVIRANTVFKSNIEKNRNYTNTMQNELHALNIKV